MNVGEPIHVQRVILLGASNLTYSFPLVLESLAHGGDGPLDVMAAHGHGRSYGMWSRVLMRGLPGITDCELWNDLRERPQTERPPAALLTDVGNDLLYGASVQEISGWVEVCLGRLAEQGAEIVITQLPLASVERLSVWRYQLTRACFFPRSDLTFSKMIESAYALNRRLEELGAAFGAHVVEPPGDWYGFDPIHIRRSHRLDAWHHIFSGWPSYPGTSPMIRVTWIRALKIWNLRPADRRLAGRRQTTPQPVLERGRLSLSLY